MNISTDRGPDNIKNIIRHGLLLPGPFIQPETTENPCHYSLATEMLQLDDETCLITVLMEEQGGPDLCIGNDGFIFRKVSDIKPENAIVVNRGVPGFTDHITGEKGYLIMGGCHGGMVPLGAKLPDGRPHPLAGKGFLVNDCQTYKEDRSDPMPDACMYLALRDLEWDGARLMIGEPEIIDFGEYKDMLFAGLNMIPFGDDFIMVVCTHPCYSKPEQSDYKPRQGDKSGAFTAVIGHDGEKWGLKATGQMFAEGTDATEGVIRAYKGGYMVSIRRTTSPIVPLFFSEDGFVFEQCYETWNHTVPRVLNQGLDGSLYLATNTGPEWLRNPLMCYPWNGESFDEPFAVHDENGIRDCSEDSIPFVDHGIAYNVTLEGRRRHFMSYRVCDLVERTAYGFQGSLKELIEGKGGPIPLRGTTGMHLVEFEY